MPDLTDREYRRDFYRAVRVLQSTPDRTEYVPIYDAEELRAQDVVQTIRYSIDFSVAESIQILSGFRGSGKTGELFRLRDELRTAGYTVVYLDVEDYFNTERPLDGSAFVVALAAGFAEKAPGSPDGQNLWSRFRDLLKRTEIDVSAEFSVGPVDIKAKLRDDDSFRAKVREQMTTNRAQFRGALHRFFREAAAETEAQEGVVFLVDSIDHFRGRTETFQEVRESVEAIFSEYADDLKLPGVHVVYTVPIYVQPALGLRRDVLNIKVAHPDQTPWEPGLAALRAVVARRAPGGDVERLLGDHLDKLILASGGLIRDLLRLIGEVILRVDHLPAADDVVTAAESAVRSNMQLALSQEQVQILTQVHTSHALVPSREQWPDATDLMARGALLRYPNGEQPWYGIHPLLRPLIPPAP